MKLALLFCLVLLPLCGRCADPVPAISVFDKAAGLVAADAPRGPVLHVAIWSDGRIIWSHRQDDGKFVFLSGHVPAERVQALLDRAEREQVFDEKAFRHSHYGPDASFTTLWLQAGAQHTRLESWHELYEKNPRAVATSGGLTSLDEGQTREQALAEDKPDYQRFRRVWSELRAAIANLTPAQGEPYTKPIQIQYPD